MADTNKLPLPGDPRPATTFKERVTNPKFLVATAGFLYLGVNYVTKQLGLEPIDLGTFQLVADMIAYVITGAGIYSVFKK